ncbi:TVA2 protein, partial [Polyodon spathula]|nr:TVA2 protein [Polyodon spathula]
LLYKLVFAGVRSQDQVSQTPPSLTVSEGEIATLHCNYTASNLYNLQWYRQRPNRSPENVMILFSDPVKDSQFSGSLDKVKSSGVFNVSNSQAEDSVTYYCAVEAQCLKAVRGPDRNTEWS